MDPGFKLPADVELTLEDLKRLDVSNSSTTSTDSGYMSAAPISVTSRTTPVTETGSLDPSLVMEFGRRKKRAGRRLERRGSDAGRDVTVSGEDAGRDVTVSGEDAGRDVTVSAEDAGRDVTASAEDAGRDVTARAEDAALAARLEALVERGERLQAARTAGIPADLQLSPAQTHRTAAAQLYTYSQLLKRLHAQKEEEATGTSETGRFKQGKQIRVPIPGVLSFGRKFKTALINFKEISDALWRQPSHLKRFLEAECACRASVDGRGMLVLRGRFTTAHFERMLKLYIKEYVACKSCKHGDTFLLKEARLTYLNCNKCGSRRSVQPIDAPACVRA